MPIPGSKAELSALLQQLGARHPAQWAASQVDEGIPQLHRFLFLKGAWDTIPRDGDATWIEREITDAAEHPTRPFAGLGQALMRCREQGVSDADLTEMARCLCAQMLFSVCHLMDDPAHQTDLPDVSWGLFQTDVDGNPSGPRIGGLHESVLDLDPTGREMRSKEGLSQDSPPSD